tara:strand:- start:955 stop:1473 length:519 start_codon:yes stop_codon:yes gene_type:complete
MPYRDFFENKSCVDVGMWKGILNAKAKKDFNCNTTIGVEPNGTHLSDCGKINPYTKLYTSIEQLPHMINTDIVLLHGVICLMGIHWIHELENLLIKVNCKYIHIRHQGGDIFNNAIPTGTKRETNRYNLNSYKDNPVSDDIIKFLNAKEFDLMDQKILSIKDSIMIFQRRNS